jgi:hypothetical protein
MPPNAPLLRPTSPPGRTLAIGMSCLLAASLVGCARSHGGRRPGRMDLGSLTPPALKGGLIRSQDGGQLARRLRRREVQGQDRALVGSVPQVRWTDPPVAAPPRPASAAQPALVEMPPPPTLPGAAGQIGRQPAPPPPAARVVSQAQPVSKPEEPAEPAPSANPIAQVRALVDRSKARLAAIQNYQVALNRQERVGNELLPPEDVLLSVRREPRAVRLEWPEGTNKGREVLYSVTETNGQMMVNTPGSLVPRVTLAPDSPLVLRSSRHPITEAGFDSILANLEQSLQPHEAGNPGRATMSYGGEETPAEVGRPCHKIVEVRENGENWVVHLDAQTDLPAMVQGTDASGALLERYLFGPPSIDVAALAEASAFDPDSRWGASRGLFGRLAGPSSGADPAASERR